MITAVTIDDEENARAALIKTIHLIADDVRFIGEAHSVKSGVTLLKTIEPDVVFLDIDMPDGTGFNLLEQLPTPPKNLVFVTAYNEFAIKAFKFNAIDYILKPINSTEIKAVINKLSKQNSDVTLEQVNALINQVATKKFDRLIVKDHDSIQFIKLEEIVHLDADSNYTHIHLVSGEKITTSKTLKDYEMTLPSTFFRIHQSHVINLHQVKKFLKEAQGYIVMSNDVELPLSKRKRPLFLDLMANC